MKPIAELKKDLVFNREMNELIDILKKVAAAQFQTVFGRWKTLGIAQRFTDLIPDFFKQLDLPSVRHPIFTNPANKVLSVIITTDTGFLGGLNTNIIETALTRRRKKDKVSYTVVGAKGREYMETKGTSGVTAGASGAAGDGSTVQESAPPAVPEEKVSQDFETVVTYEPFMNVVVLGEKGRDYMDGAAQKTALDFMPGVSDEVALEEAQRLSHHIFSVCLHDKIGKVMVTYPKFISFAQQEVEVFDLFEWLKPAPVDTQPVKDSTNHLGNVPVTYEPFLDKVADYLLRLWLTHKLYEIYWHSKLSEFAARMAHLEGSLQELKEMKKQISLLFFKGKHEITDRTIRDIFAGLLTAKKRKRLVMDN